MTNRFMMSVAAAALIAGTGFASAQGTGGREAPSAGPAAQQSAPSSDRAAPSSATPTNRGDASDKAAPAAKTTQSDEKMQPGTAKSQRAQDDIKAGPKGEKSAQDTNLKGEKSAQDNPKGEKSKSMTSETNEKGPAAKDMKAEGRNGTMNPDSKGAAENKAGPTGTESRTTGNAATSAAAAPPPEKRTQIVSAIKSEKIEEVTNVNFELNVGARVPTTVRFYPLPPRIVEIYPEWRDYEVIRVHGRYVILRPQTHEIVYIIEG
jgi:hypothetical protein